MFGNGIAIVPRNFPSGDLVKRGPALGVLFMERKIFHDRCL